MQKVFVYNLQRKEIIKPNDKVIIEVNKINSLFNIKEDFKPGDIFISYDHKTPLDFRLEYYNIPYNSLVIATEETDIKKLLDKDLIQEHFLEDYPVFSGKKLTAIRKESKITILRSFKILVDVMYQMLEAGYLENKNYKKIDDWIISYEDPILKLIKIYHQIETSNPSIDFEEEFLINPQFRQMNLLMIMKIIANFVINNNMITLEEVSKLGDWEEKEVWKKLRKKVKLLAEKEEK